MTKGKRAWYRLLPCCGEGEGSRGEQVHPVVIENIAAEAFHELRRAQRAGHQLKVRDGAVEVVVDEPGKELVEGAPVLERRLLVQLALVNHKGVKGKAQFLQLFQKLPALYDFVPSSTLLLSCSSTSTTVTEKCALPALSKEKPCAPASLTKPTLAIPEYYSIPPIPSCASSAGHLRLEDTKNINFCYIILTKLASVVLSWWLLGF